MRFTKEEIQAQKYYVRMLEIRWQEIMYEWCLLNNKLDNAGADLEAAERQLKLMEG